VNNNNIRITDVFKETIEMSSRIAIRTKDLLPKGSLNTSGDDEVVKSIRRTLKDRSLSGYTSSSKSDN